MTARGTGDDLDRLLGDWLGEGPARTPEPVVDLAMQHATGHPRRPDPLAFLRRDPMASGRTVFGLPAIPVLATIGLLAAAVIGVSLAGGQGEIPPIVPTDTSPPSSVPSVGPTIAPTIGPSTGPTASTVAPTGEASGVPGTGVFQVGLRTPTDATMTVRVVDPTGALVDARTAPPVQGGSQPADVVGITNVDEHTLLLVWTDAACDIAYTLTLDSPTSMRLRSPTCNGDTIPVDRRLLLQYAAPVDAAEVTATVVRVP